MEQWGRLPKLGRTIKTNERGRLSWGMSVYAILAAIIVFVPLVVSRNGTDLLYLFVVVPGLFLIGLCVLIYAAIRKNLSIAVMVAVFFATLALLFTYEIKRPVGIRSAIRWFLWSPEYKAEVLAQPASTNGDLKHIEWDGWGFVPAGQTTVYVVFDPMDTLAAAARGHQAGKFKGIPCEVLLVRRLESHWYTVLFYTEESWGQCT